MSPSYIVPIDSLPSDSSVIFTDSSYFLRNGKDATFPTRSIILAKATAQAPEFQHNRERPPVYFEDLGLIVKFGREPKVNIAEGQCLWALQQVAPKIPVPEVYGWTQDSDYTYLFMELVHGITLEKIWSALSGLERVQICEQLRSMLVELRRLRQEPDSHFLGDIHRGPFADIVFTNGVLPLQAHLHRQHWPGIDPTEIPDPYRQGLPDDSAVVFTHSDLHPSNIIISSEKPYCIVAIIDWQQSGWYPDYWEFCKAEYTAEVGSEWIKEYIPRFLEEPGCVEAFELYSKAFGY